MGEMEPPSKKQKLNISLEENELAPDTTQEEQDIKNIVCQDGMDGEESSSKLDDKYTDFVSQEELERLREFQVLDEVKSNDEDSNGEDSDSSDGQSEGVPEEEIEKMLDEDLPESLKAAPKPKEKPFVTRQKVVLEEKGVNQFEVLPLDWMMVRHYSGVPVYMHRSSRVCTLSKPYFLGKGNTRRHDIPISAIPCLAYRKALEEEEKQKEIDREIEEQIRNGSWKQQIPNYANDTDTNTSKTDTGLGSKCPVSLNHTKIPVFENVSTNVVSNSAQNDTILSDNVNDVMVDINSGNSSQNNENEVTGEINQNNVKNEETSKVSEGVLLNSQIKKCPFNHAQITIQDTNITSNNVNEPTVLKQEIKNSENVQKDNDNTNLVANDELTTEKVTTDQANENSGDSSRNNEEIPTKNDENGTEEENKSSREQNANNGEKNSINEIPLNRQPVVLPDGVVMPPPRVETLSTSWKTQHLTYEQVNDYCKKLFKFKTVNIMHFKRWADRRKYTKARKTLQFPTLPEGTKLITIPAQVTGQENGGAASKRDWVMNMNGRSYLSEFHEYVRRALKKQPVYEFKQLENAAAPYQATVRIGGMQYGVGRGGSKRAAKAAAARASIHILIPEMRHDELHPPSAEPDLSFFDHVGIEDPRITEFCAAACEPSPHAILRTCLLRNFGAGDRHIHTEMKKLEYQKIELTMKVGKHTATVVCKNKKTAKQRASQAILQALHPHVQSWGSLLRLYGSRSVKSCKEKKLEEQQITLLQDAARHNEPNYAVLEKLRNEMRKLRERDEAVVPIGTLLVSDDLPTHSGSNLNNVDL